MLSLLLRIEGIFRLKSATQSAVCNLSDGTYIGYIVHGKPVEAPSNKLRVVK